MHRQPTAPPTVHIIYQRRWYRFDPVDPTPIHQLLAAGLTIAHHEMIAHCATIWRMSVGEVMHMALESEAQL